MSLKWNRIALALGITIFNVSPLVAQNDCIGLLQHGIYDTFRQTSGNMTATAYKADLCQSYSKLQTDRKAGAVQAHYGLAGGEGNYTSDQLDQLGESMCASTANNTYSQADLNTFQQVIDPSAVSAYKACISQNSSGLKTKTTIRETDAGQMTLDMYYIAPVGGSPNVAITKIDITPSTFKCSGPLWDMQGTSSRIDTHLYSMSCTRAIKQIPDPGSDILAPSATVAVLTDVGSTTVNFAPIKTGPPPIPDLPIGAVISFFLSPKEIQNLAPKWIPADGTTINTATSGCNGQKLPDLQDRFVLGGSALQDVKPDNSNTAGGNYSNIVHVTVTGATTDAVTLPDVRDLWSGNLGTAPGSPPRYVNDTTANELSASNHVHKISFTQDVPVMLVPPPFRRLVYLIHCQ
jgi:hypothetical protein